MLSYVSYCEVEFSMIQSTGQISYVKVLPNTNIHEVYHSGLVKCSYRSADYHSARLLGHRKVIKYYRCSHIVVAIPHIARDCTQPMI